MNVPMMKCQAQHKFLGRTDGGQCSLNGGLPPNIDFAKSSQLIHGIEDADAMGLLFNGPIGKKSCCNKVYTWGLPKSEDYWENYAYSPNGGIKWDELGSKIKRGY